MLEDYEYSFPKNPKDRMKDGAVMFVLSLVLAGICALTTSGEVFQLAALALVFGLIFSGFGIFEMLRGWYSHRRQIRYDPLQLSEQEVSSPIPAAPEAYADWFLSGYRASYKPETGTTHIVQQLFQLDAAQMEQLWQKAEYDDFSEYRSYTFPSSTDETLTLVWKRTAAPEIWPPES
jgi:hypothetical protein